MGVGPYEFETFYSQCSPIIVGCTLYSDNPLTTPVVDNYYSDGTFCYQVFGGNGVVIAKTSCDDYFTTTTSTTTTSTSTAQGFYLTAMYEDTPFGSIPSTYCAKNYAALPQLLQNMYITKIGGPSTLQIGDYLSPVTFDGSCPSTWNGLPLSGWVFTWINPDNSSQRIVFRTDETCTIYYKFEC
jgi:hypothetical protein